MFEEIIKQARLPEGCLATPIETVDGELMVLFHMEQLTAEDLVELKKCTACELKSIVWGTMHKPLMVAVDTEAKE